MDVQDEIEASRRDLPRRLRIVDPAGLLVEEGEMRKIAPGKWSYTALMTFPNRTGFRFEVTATDINGEPVVTNIDAIVGPPDDSTEG